MIRFTARLNRTPAAFAGALVAAVLVLVLASRPHLMALYREMVGSCTSNCDRAIEGFQRTDTTLRDWLGLLVLVAPALVGAFWGAPVVARELETGTFRLAWTQGVSRTRWLLTRLAVGGAISMAVAELLALVVGWWASPLDTVNAARFASGTFDARGVVPLGYAAFAFMLGVTAGVFVKRTLPSVLTALVAYLVVRLSFARWARPHLLPAVVGDFPTRAGDGQGFVPFGPGTLYEVGPPHIPDALVVSHHLADASGHAVTSSSLSAFVEQACPTIAHPSAVPSGVIRAPGDQDAFAACLDKLGHSFHLVASYQPADRYWTIQFLELGVFLAVAAALVGVCVWRVRRL